MSRRSTPDKTRRRLARRALIDRRRAAEAAAHAERVAAAFADPADPAELDALTAELVRLGLIEPVDSDPTGGDPA